VNFCSGREIAGFATGLVSEEHQVKPYGLELTVAKVFIVKKEGDIDFGGSEEKEALIEELEPGKRSPGDKYGWWALTSGEYLIEYNEKIEVPEGCMAIIQTLQRTLKAGVIHPTVVLTPGEKVRKMLLQVGKSGFNIKENARVSLLMGIKAVKG